MSKISFGKILQRKQRTKVITIVITTLLLVFIGGYFISKSPSLTHAASYYNSGTNVLNIDDVSCTATLTLYGAGVPNGGTGDSDDSLPQRIVVTGGTCGTISTEVNGTTLPSNVSVVIANKEVKMFTNPGVPFQAKNITINNGGVLTHDLLIATTDFNPAAPTFALNLNGQRKKVDLDILYTGAGTGNLTITGNGKINVDSKGYPGRDGSGYGPGFSLSNSGYSGGAGYGGAGGDAKQNGSIGGVAYPSIATASQLTELLPGSSSGSDDGANGASGGGIIQLRIGGQLTIGLNGLISSNGNNGSDLWFNHGSGGGSGGSIKITFLANQVQSPSVNVSWGDKSGNGQDGAAGTVYISGVVLAGNAPDRIQAKGGDVAVLSDSGGGGGGRIALFGVDSPGTLSANITKTLTAVERNGLPDTSFNPYALQKGDKIKITLTVSGIKTFPYILEDPWLKTINNTKICTPINGTYAGLGNPFLDTSDSQNKKIVWTFISTDPSSPIVEYQCLVN